MMDLAVVSLVFCVCVIWRKLSRQIKSPPLLPSCKAVQIALEQIFRGIMPSQELLNIQSSGSWMTPLTCSIDVSSVWGHDKQGQVPKLPTEEGLILQVHAMREALKLRQISKLFWIDTGGMLADGLNKGGLDRTPLQRAMSQNIWHLAHKFLSAGQKSVGTEGVVAGPSSCFSDQLHTS